MHGKHCYVFFDEDDSTTWLSEIVYPRVVRLSVVGRVVALRIA